VLGNLDIHIRSLELYLCILICTKINLKWSKDLNARLETLILLEENIGKALWDISLGDDFMNKIPMPQKIRTGIV
jgi:hypothetical protein